MFWYNPNIHPYAEYKARRDCLREYAKLINVELAEIDAYGLDEFCRNVIDKLSTRCEEYCYPKRLRTAFEYARDNGYGTVSTTLLYSIYQNHDFIAELCERLAEEYGLNFLYRDFREGWREGQEEARALKLYMQKYCGCVFSEEESGIGRELSRKMKKVELAPTNKNVRQLIEENKDAGLIIVKDIATSIAKRAS